MTARLLALPLVAVLALAGVAAAQTGTDKPAQPTTPPATTPATKPADAKPAEPKPGETKPAPQEDKIVTVKIATSLGDITVDLNETKAPITVANFLTYVDKGFYNGTIFHRVIETFMIQGGGFTADMAQKPTDPAIKNEWRNGLTNKRGTIAMARLGGKADSATSQFFINVVDNAGLDRPQSDGAAYAVFGTVTSGMDVVDKIKAVKTGAKPTPSGQRMGDVPMETVTITAITRATGAAKPPAKEPAKDKPAEPKK